MKGLSAIYDNAEIEERDDVDNEQPNRVQWAENEAAHEGGINFIAEQEALEIERILHEHTFHMEEHQNIADIIRLYLQSRKVQGLLIAQESTIVQIADLLWI